MLQGVVDGTVGSFVSRNNDVDGYWAIGKLCRLAHEASTRRVEVDLLDGEMCPESELSRGMISTCRGRLQRHLVKLGLPESAVAQARLVITFDRDRPRGPSMGPSPASTHFHCLATIVDDAGRTYEAERSGWCWPHDPSKELRSTRVASSP